MPRTLWSRLAAAFLVLLLASSATFAAPRPSKPTREPGVIAWISKFLHRFLPATLEAHGTMDPDGNPGIQADPGGTQGDAHGTMDPNG
jgi:hypothetical protein